jgi:hypothetical protein
LTAIETLNVPDKLSSHYTAGTCHFTGQALLYLLSWTDGNRESGRYRPGQQETDNNGA